MRVLITGASGCVGHYLVESLLNSTDYELFLLVRNPQKLLFPSHPRINIVLGRIQDISLHRDLLNTIDIVISAAASWGGKEEVFSTNVDGTVALFNSLNPDRVKRAIYFSTASILDRHHQLLPQAETIGTDYIKSKYQALQKLESSWINDRLTVVFPTLVFGGGHDKPYSHLSGGLKEVTKYIHWIRWFKTEGTFHFIHGKDIATVITHLVTAFPEHLPPRIVLGNPAITVNQAIGEACKFFNVPIWGQINLSPWLIDILIKLFQVKMEDWDRFCLAQKHFTYDVVNPETFNYKSFYPHLTDLLTEINP